MRFENEVNIYNPNALSRKFSAIQTDFDVTLGKISAIVSESEIEEYLNGHTTMNSKLSSVIQDISGVHTQISTMKTEYEEGFQSVDSKLTTVDETIDGIRAEVSSVQSEYNGLETRVSAAETKIEPNAIVATVRSSDSYKSDLNSKSTTYTGDYIPTTSNSPASAWTTTALKESHINDTFLTSGGELYQYISGHNGLMITFSSDSQTENARYDYARIYYKIGDTTYVLPDVGGTDIAGASVFVPSNEFWLYWRSDRSVSSYGFRIADIKWTFSNTPTLTEATLPEIDPIETSGTNYPETTHPYTDNEEKLWKYTTSNTASVNPSYGWANREDSGIRTLTDRMSSAELKITDSAIISTVTETVGGKTALNSVIDQRADSIRLKADKISWSSTYSSMTEDGTLTASNVELTGKITATSGYIGTAANGFNISSSAIYNGISSVGATSGTGVYIGTDGMNLGGGKFKVTSAGALQWTATNSSMASDGSLTVSSLTADKYIYVDGNKNSFFRLPLYPWNSTSSSDATYFQISNSGMFIKVWANEVGEGSAGMEYTTAEFGNSSSTERKRAITLTCSSFSVQSGIGAGLINFTDSSQSTTFYSSLTAKGLNSRGSGDSYLSSYYLYDSCYINGSLKVTGTKNRVVSTDDYSDRLLYCYETPSPLFGDIGEGEIGEDGKCYVWLDPIFAQTIRTANYQVSLQSYSPSFAYVIERTDAYFIVGGEPGAKFGWEIKAKQADFAENRLDRFEEQREDDSVNYGLLARNHIQELTEGRYVE